MFSNICEIVKKRIMNTPLTSMFLIFGLTLSMLLISIVVSFVSQYMIAQEEKKNAQPPNGRQYVLTWTKQDISYTYNDIFKNMREDTGVIVNGVMVHFDEGKVNSYSAVSGEWFSDDNVWHYPLTEGRYYTAEEIANGEKVVLIGRNYEEYVYEENGKKYIYIEKEQYEVLGIVGMGDDISLWDARVFVPCTSIPKITQSETDRQGYISFILSNDDEEFSEDETSIYNNALMLFGEANITYIGNITASESISSLINTDDIIFSVATMGYLVSLVYSINIVVFWIENRRKEIGIRKAVGFKNKDIAKLLMAEMMGFCALSCGIALMLQFIFSLFYETLAGYNLKIYSANIVVGLVLVVFTAILISALPIVKTLKIEAIEVLRKE